MAFPAIPKINRYHFEQLGCTYPAFASRMINNNKQVGVSPSREQVDSAYHAVVLESYQEAPAIMRKLIDQSRSPEAERVWDPETHKSPDPTLFWPLWKRRPIERDANLIMMRNAGSNFYRILCPYYGLTPIEQLDFIRFVERVRENNPPNCRTAVMIEKLWVSVIHIMYHFETPERRAAAISLGTCSEARKWCEIEEDGDRMSLGLGKIDRARNDADDEAAEAARAAYRVELTDASRTFQLPHRPGRDGAS